MSNGSTEQINRSTDKHQIQQLRLEIERLKVIEEQYRQVEDLLNQAIHDEPPEAQNGTIVIYTIPNTGQIIDASKQMAAFLGYTREDLLTRTVGQIEVPNSQTNRAQYVESATQIEDYNSIYWHRNCHKVPVSVQKWLITKNGEHLLCYAVKDKSVRTQLERELSRRESVDYQFREKLKTLNQITIQLGHLRSFDEVCRHSIKLAIQQLGFDRLSLWFLNPAETEMVGTFGVDESGNIRDEREESWRFADSYIEDFMNGKRDPIVIYDGAPLYNSKSELIGHGWHISVPILDGDKFIGFMGADNYIHKKTLLDYQPELLFLYGMTVGRIAANQIEQETVRQLYSAIQHSSSMVIVLNKNQTVQFANNAYCQLSGYTLPETVGSGLENLFSLEHLDAIKTSLLAGGSWKGEITNRRKNGDPYETIVSISPIYSGEVIENFVIVQEDITLIRQSREKELKLRLEQERTKIIDLFISDLGHEFKNPLMAILTSSYILKRSPDEDKRTKHFGLIKNQVNVLTHVIDKILDIVKFTQTLELKNGAIDLGEFLQRTIKAVTAAEENKQIHWDIDAPLGLQLEIDQEKLTRIMHEILKNAIQFTPLNGRIQVKLITYDQSIGIVIEDNGIGIPGHELEEIFTRFYRVDKARTSRHAGLGLAIAKLLTDALHGEIQVISALGRGSRFEVLLPYQLPALSAG